MAGYDLDVIKLFLKTNSCVVLVGDPRQVTYLTHFSAKYKKYAGGGIKKFIENELGKKIECNIDETTLSVSHRNNQLICNYSAKLYPDLPIPISCECDNCQKNDEHVGVFVIKHSQIEQYLQTYKPVQLRWNASTQINLNYNVLNFGESKGITTNRVLIYPTEPMKKWIRNNSSQLTSEARSKFYVGLTRAKLSATIVMDYKEGESFDGIVIES